MGLGNDHSHLDMALLETPLDPVKVCGIEADAVVIAWDWSINSGSVVCLFQVGGIRLRLFVHVRGGEQRKVLLEIF